MLKNILFKLPVLGLMCIAAFGQAEVVSAERIRIAYLSANPLELRKLTGPAKMILDARRISETVFFSEVPEAIERGVVVGKEGRLSFKQDRSCQIVNPGIRAIPGQVLHKAPDKNELKRAVLLYRKAIEELAKDGRERKRVAAPYYFLGGVYLGLVSDGFSITGVRKGYQIKPSDLAALAYLELALLEKKLGRKEEYSRLLKETVAKLNLMEIHYWTDIIFRQHLLGELNFARPETCLLFLAGEDARLKGQVSEARKYYTTLIERAPGSPFAWESLAKLEAIGDVKPDQMKWLKSILLHTYPLVWGCPRENLKLDKEAFAAELPALLKKVDKEEGKNKK